MQGFAWYFAYPQRLRTEKEKITPYFWDRSISSSSRKMWENASVSSSSAYKIIGNAVPCVLTYHIAMRMARTGGAISAAGQGNSMAALAGAYLLTAGCRAGIPYKTANTQPWAFPYFPWNKI